MAAVVAQPQQIEVGSGAIGGRAMMPWREQNFGFCRNPGCNRGPANMWRCGASGLRNVIAALALTIDPYSGAGFFYFETERPSQRPVSSYRVPKTKKYTSEPEAMAVKPALYHLILTHTT